MADADIEVKDNRLAAQNEAIFHKPAPIVQGNLLQVHSWEGATYMFCTLDTGYTVLISKKSLERINNWFEENKFGSAALKDSAVRP